MNKLYYGDCLTVIRELLHDTQVDLIYLDPPFNSNRAYNAIYTTETGHPLPDQVEAFCDAWVLDDQREHAIRALPLMIREAGLGDDVAAAWQVWPVALRKSNPRLLAYLSYMVERLIWMKDLLKPTGSLYLHCDPTASHYLKLVLDSIFGHKNFRNEIVWKRHGTHSDAKGMGAVHDCILHYTMNRRCFTFNKQYTAYDKQYIDKRYNRRDEDGRRWLAGPLTAQGLSGGGYEYEYKGYHATWRVPLKRMRELDAQNRLHVTRSGRIEIKRYLDEMKGLPLGDVWTDIKPLGPTARERLGYATQKPVALLERIIAASTNPGDVVLDPFCGCATTMEAAHKLKRHWIGIDVAIHAIKRVSAVRLEERLGLVEGTDYTIEGIPRNVEGAKDLWHRDKYHFQKWAVEQAEGFVTNQRSADGGVDGRLYFEGNDPKRLDSMIMEVKGGQRVGIADVRSLRGALAPSGALLAGLIVLHPLGRTQRHNFQREMAQAGRVTLRGRDYPKMQLLTAQDLLDGTLFDTPPPLGRKQESQQRLRFGS